MDVSWAISTMKVFWGLFFLFFWQSSSCRELQYISVFVSFLLIFILFVCSTCKTSLMQLAGNSTFVTTLDFRTSCAASKTQIECFTLCYHVNAFLRRACYHKMDIYYSWVFLAERGLFQGRKRSHLFTTTSRVLGGFLARYQISSKTFKSLFFFFFFPNYLSFQVMGPIYSINRIWSWCNKMDGALGGSISFPSAM